MAKISKKLIENYALLIAKAGGAVQKGQYVLIKADVELQDFAALVAKACYKLGAKRVTYSWTSAVTDRVGYRYAKAKDLGEMTEEEYGQEEYRTNKLPVLIYLDGEDPDGLKGVKADKLAQVKAMRYAKAKELIVRRENKYQWVIAGAPTVKWAKKVFPNLSKTKAVNALWEAILKTARADDGNGIENWEKHNAILKEKCAKLNAMNLSKLHYRSQNGTDFTVGLIPNVKFEGGSEKTIQGISFEPNIPSEECFTSPMKGEAEGVVYSAKPLVYQGQLIDNFWIRFEKGKAVDCHAETGEELLRSIFTLDEGSAYLGECALVPFDSPINNTGLIFYSTLYDENAACHLALGRGFTQLYPDFEKYSEEEIHSFGINESLSHVDFMIGTKDLSITGITANGKEIAIFKDGNFAF